MSKSRLIPFRLMPASWGLHGQAYDEAEAAYLYQGEELARRIVAIRYSGDIREKQKQNLAIDLEYNQITPYQYDVRMLELNAMSSDERAVLGVELRHGKITEYDYDRTMARLNLRKGESFDRVLLDIDHKYEKLTDYEHAKRVIELDFEGRERDEKLLELEKKCGHLSEYDYERALANLDEEGPTRDVKLADIELKHGKITQKVHEKRVATIREEPWVGVIDDGFDLNQGMNGLYFELDWNVYWVDYLRMNGYGGATEDDIIEQWFEDTCRTYANERQGSDEFNPRPSRSNRIDRGDGRADYI